MPAAALGTRNADVWAIVLAAGSGARFGGQKQFAVVAGRPLLEWSCAAVAPICAEVILVLPAARAASAALPVGVSRTVSGGATRGHSVAAAVALVPPSVEIVVVHDAAHPLADAAQASAVVASLRADEAAVAAVPALAVHESLVHASTDGVAAAIAATRGSLQVQMPHAFRADTLRQMVATPSGASDEVAALVLQGERVRLVPGSPNNVHVTSPAELAMAALLLRHRPTDKE